MSERGGFLLTLTLRPQAIVVHLFDRLGQECGRVDRVFEQEPGEDGPYRLQADEALSSCITLMESGLRRAGISAYDISGIGLCVSCHVLVIWNSVSGTPLLTVDTPATWPSLGSSSAAAFLRAAVAAARAEPGAASALHDLRIGGMDSWLLWSFTQGDCSMLGQGHDLSLYAYTDQLQLYTDFADECGLPAICFPDARQAGKPPRISSLYLDAARPPVCALTYIQTASLIGTQQSGNTGAFITYDREGAVALNLPHNSMRQVESLGVLGYRPLHSLRSSQSLLALMGRFTAPQIVVEWLQTQMSKEPVIAEVAALMNQAGPIILPAYPWFPDQGAIIGLLPGTSSDALYAAALKAMAFTVAAILDEAELMTGQRISMLYADELGFGIPSLFSFQAGLCRTPFLARSGDSSALGTAALVGVTVGLWSPEQATELLDEHFTVRRYDVPQLEESVWEHYAQWRSINSQLQKVTAAGIGNGFTFSV